MQRCHGCDSRVGGDGDCFPNEVRRESKRKSVGQGWWEGIAEKVYLLGGREGGREVSFLSFFIPRRFFHAVWRFEIDDVRIGKTTPGWLPLSLFFF